MMIMVYWKKFWKERVDELAKSGTVYDIGGGAAPQDRKKFKHYVLVDVNEAYNPDIIADIHDLPFDNNSIESILCLSVLEHVDNPFKAVDEIYRVLKPGGKALFFLPFYWPYHPSKFYKDYWRFSEDGIRLLLKRFKRVEIVKSGGHLSTMTNMIPYKLKVDRLLRPIAERLDSSLLRSKSVVSAYLAFAVK
jgi:ubiquinone/menaquinone biosynthesis C-methylase UbiE